MLFRYRTGACMPQVRLTRPLQYTIRHLHSKLEATTHIPETVRCSAIEICRVDVIPYLALSLSLAQKASGRNHI